MAIKSVQTVSQIVRTVKEKSNGLFKAFKRFSESFKQLGKISKRFIKMFKRIAFLIKRFLNRPNGIKLISICNRMGPRAIKD